MSIFAGAMIGIGCIAYLVIGGWIGAILFSLGLMTVCLFELKLFTGQAYKLTKKQISIKELLLIWGGNLLGIAAIAFIAYMGPFAQKITEGSIAIMESRAAVGFLGCFLGAIPCGLLMTFAVSVPKDQPMRLFYIMFAVAGFIVCGFFHCVADMFYTICGGTNWKHFVNIIPVTLGNFVGCNIYYFVKEKVL